MFNSTNSSIYYFSELSSDSQINAKRELEDIIADTNDLVTTGHNLNVLDILCSSFNYKKEILIYMKDHKIEGFIPLLIIGNKAVSVPHFSYGGYIGRNQISSHEYLDFINSLKAKYKGDFLIRDFKKITDYVFEDKVACFLELEHDPEQQFKKFTSKLRSQIRKAEKNGLRVEEASIDEFFSIYLISMHRLGSPHLPLEFFHEIQDNYHGGMVKVFSVRKDNQIIGSSIVLSFKDFSEVTWAATLKEYNHLAPNMLLYWEMINYCITNGMKVFSFGRATKNTGSLKFKKQWGSEEIQLSWNYGTPRKLRVESLTFLTNIWKYCPQFIIRRLGPLLTRYIY